MARTAGRTKDETRAAILESASRLFRERGYRATSVEDLMRDAGLTVGGFYAHFESKSLLLAEVIRRNGEATRQDLLRAAGREAPLRDFQEFLDLYVSEVHRDRRHGGCLLPSIAAEASRLDPSAREVLDGALRAILRSPSVGRSRAASRKALAGLCAGIGAIAMSRAVEDPGLSREILSSVRDLLGLPSPPRPSSLSGDKASSDSARHLADADQTDTA